MKPVSKTGFSVRLKFALSGNDVLQIKLVYRWNNLTNKLLQFNWNTNNFFFSDKIIIGILSTFHRASFISHKRNNLFHFIVSCKYFTFFEMAQWLLYWHCTAFLEPISVLLSFFSHFCCCTSKVNWEQDVHLGWKWSKASLSRYINDYFSHRGNNSRITECSALLFPYFWN